MTNTEKYLDSIDGPADEDLADVADLAEQDDSVSDLFADDDDLDFDSNYVDDRYEGDGVPRWSAWA